MKKTRNTYILVLILSALGAVVLAIIRDIALLTEFDGDILFYETDAALPVIFGALAVVFVAALILFTMMMKDDFAHAKPIESSALSVFFSLLLAFIMAAYFGFNVMYNITEDMSKIDLALMILTLPAACYLILSCIPQISKNVRTLLGITMILWLFSLVLSVYFESGIAINNPNRMIELTYICLLMMYFVNECKYRLKNQSTATYIFFGLSSVIVGGLYSIPNVVLLFFERYPDTIDVPVEIILFLMWCYTLFRMCLFASELNHKEGAAEISDTVTTDETL